MIEARGLVKRYGSTTAVDNLSFDVRPGTVTGFLGPNGAGKSTTMRMILGLDRPDAGRVKINGQGYHDLRWPLREVGSLLEAKAFHPGRTARAHLTALAASNQIPRHRVNDVLEITGLAPLATRGPADRRAGKFSLGMAQRLGIAAALLGDPAVLLLDEPVNGLDPEGIRWIRGLLKNLAAQDRTVLISSHLISEVALSADQLIVNGQGRLFAQTTVAELSARSSSLEEAFFQLTEGSTEYSSDYHHLRSVSTTATLDRAARPGSGQAEGRYGFRSVARMEWLKLRSVRSTSVDPAGLRRRHDPLAVLVMAHYALGRRCRPAPGPASTRPTTASPGWPSASSPSASWACSQSAPQLLLGLIRATFAAAPRRPLVLAAETAVLAAVTLVAGEIMAFAAFALGEAVLRARAPHATLAQPGVLRAVLIGRGLPGPDRAPRPRPGRADQAHRGAISAVVGVLFVLR